MRNDLLDRLPEVDRPIWERRLSRLRNACGCKSGAVFLFGFVAFYLAVAIGRGDGLGLADAGWLIGGVFVASVAGKLLGIAVARVGLLITTALLSRRF